MSQPDLVRRHRLVTGLVLVPAAFLLAALFFLTAQHNAQLKAQVEVHNAQLVEQTDTSNRVVPYLRCTKGVIQPFAE